jgi:hypothetical protein
MEDEKQSIGFAGTEDVDCDINVKIGLAKAGFVLSPISAGGDCSFCSSEYEIHGYKYGGRANNSTFDK